MDKKLTIRAYKSRARSGSGAGSIEVKLNPESFATRHEHRYAKYRGINSSLNTATYAYSLAEEMSFQLVIVDGKILNSGNLLGASGESVAVQITKFKEVCYNMNGDIHEPNFLNIKWGEVNFDCKLKAMDIRYTSFDGEGRPRRAELDVTFVEDILPGKAARIENKSSPDLTHIMVVKEGDTLPLLTEKVYGPSRTGLYLEIARVNKLNDFRNLQVGQRLFFPPLDKHINDQHE
jgi:LysM repeat protein